MAIARMTEALGDRFIRMGPEAYMQMCATQTGETTTQSGRGTETKTKTMKTFCSCAHRYACTPMAYMPVYVHNM